MQQDAVTTVREFFAAMEVKAVTEALELADPGIVWKNTSLPDVRGIDRVRWVLDKLSNPRYGFRVDMHHIAADADGVVLTERTDYLRFRPWRSRSGYAGHSSSSTVESRCGTTTSAGRTSCAAP